MPDLETELQTVQADNAPDPEPEPDLATIIADQLSQLISLVASMAEKVEDTHTKISAMEATLSQLADVNPQELMGLLKQLGG